MEKLETKFWFLLGCLSYWHWFTEANIPTSLCWGRCIGQLYAFTRRWYDIQGCNGCLKQPFWTRRMLCFRGIPFVKLRKERTSRRWVLSEDYVNLTPRVNFSIRIAKSVISSLISVRLMAYVVIYFKNPTLH